MAKGTDSEEFVLLSVPRTGLKREFVFALKAQSEVSGSFGRTRARKLQDSPSSDRDLGTTSNKRLKSCLTKEENEETINDTEKLSIKEETLKDVDKIPVYEETLKDVDKILVNEETLSDSGEIAKDGESKIDMVDSRSEELPKDDQLKCRDEEERKSDLLKSPSTEEPKSNGIIVETPIVIDGYSNLTNAVVEKPLRRFTRSALKGEEEQPKIDGNREVQNTLLEKPKRWFTRSALESKEEVIMDDYKEVKSASMENPKKRFTCSALETHIAVEMVMDDIGEVGNALMETPTKQVTHSALESETDDTLLDVNKEVNVITETSMKPLSSSVMEQEEELVTNAENRGEQNVSSEKPLIYALKPEEDIVATTENLDEQKIISEKTTKRARSALETNTELVVTSEDCEKQNLSLEKPTRRFTRSLLEPRAEPTVVAENCDQLNVSTEKPMRRFTRSLLETKAEPIVMDCNSEVPNAIPVEPPRRFTRSALKPKEEKMDTHLETPEATQSAICSPVKNSTICLNCKGPLPAHSKRSVPVCNSCLESKKPYASPANRTGIDARSKPGLTPKASDSASRCLSSQNKSGRGKITRKDLRLHKLVFEEDGLPDGTELAYFQNGKKLLEGYKKGFGIFCRCCNSEISASQFEAHAGFASRRKPYLSIYTSNGVSLHELSLSLSKGRKFSANYNDDLCGICEDFGDLLLCDGCPRAFHRDCVGQSSIPQGDWYCPYCQNMFQREGFCASNANAVAAGRVDGVDPIEEISKRCIRIVETTETEVSGGCTLCRCQGFSKSGFGPRTVIICDQCEKEFHVGCLKDHKMGDLKELPQGNWFCSTDCCRIRTALQKLIIRGSEKLPVSLLSVVKKKLEEKCLNSDADLDVRWMLLSGKTTSPESRSVLSKAVAIFHDRFDPIVDSRTGRDLIPAMIYGRNKKDQDFGGMYCAVLTINSSVVSAGILRIFGKEVAELPLVATSSDYQGQGYFQSLFSCIERLLGFLNVKSLVLPAAAEAEAIWTDRFGFKKMSVDQLSEYRKHCQMTTFQGTSMLQKAVPKCRIIDKPVAKS